MCFALLALNQHPHYPFILAANRDEFYARPTQAMQNWEDEPDILGGRDLQAMGSWLALNQQDGRFALVTNVRDGAPQSAPKSRGALVHNMVRTDQPFQQELTELQNQQHDYAGFNLLTGHLPGEIYYCSNRNQQTTRLLSDGLYGLSNASLDTSWPKVRTGKQALSELIEHNQGKLDPERLFQILNDTTQPPDSELPDTGIGLEKERWLSPLFINSEAYGTRCSTVILVDRGGQVFCQERTFIPGLETTDRVFRFTAPSPPDHIHCKSPSTYERVL